jgi:hypothetical protein
MLTAVARRALWRVQPEQGIDVCQILRSSGSTLILYAVICGEVIDRKAEASKAELIQRAENILCVVVLGSDPQFDVVSKARVPVQRDRVTADNEEINVVGDQQREQLAQILLQLHPVPPDGVRSIQAHGRDAAAGSIAPTLLNPPWRRRGDCGRHEQCAAFRQSKHVSAANEPSTA